MNLESRPVTYLAINLDLYYYIVLHVLVNES